jgi:hypothetical protein
MKHILPFLLLFTAHWAGAQQQVLEILPNPNVSTFQVDLKDFWAEPIAPSRIKNLSDQTINLRWEREVMSAPAGWEFRVCDTIACYTSSVVSNVVFGGQPNLPVPILKKESTKLDLHVLPRGIEGCAEVRLKLTDATNPNNLLSSAVYKICVGSLTPVTEQENNQIRIFPNPASDYISMSRNTVVRQIWVSNILGKRIKSFNVSYPSRYDISDIPDGIYMVSLIDSKGSIFKTLRLSKRSPRA